MKRIEQKVYYKLIFSIEKITEEEACYVRNAMDNLEKEAPIMRCFQNVYGDAQGIPTRLNIGDVAATYSIYYRGKNVDCINRFLFKMRLKFLNFEVTTSHTLQEYF